MNPKQRANEVLKPWLKYDRSFLDDTRQMLTSRIETQINLAVMEAIRRSQSLVSGQYQVDGLYGELSDTWARPMINDALRLVHQKLGELDGIMMCADIGDRQAASQIPHWLGDVQLRLCSLALALNLDLGIALGQRINYYRNKYGKDKNA